VDANRARFPGDAPWHGSEDGAAAPECHLARGASVLLPCEGAATRQCTRIRRSSRSRGPEGGARHCGSTGVRCQCSLNPPPCVPNPQPHTTTTAAPRSPARTYSERLCRGAEVPLVPVPEPDAPSEPLPAAGEAGGELESWSGPVPATILAPPDDGIRDFDGQQAVDATANLVPATHDPAIPAAARTPPARPAHRQKALASAGRSVSRRARRAPVAARRAPS
jgi:hypothetical protein